MTHLGILAYSIAIDLEPSKLQWCINQWQNYQIGTSFDDQVSRHKLWPTLEFCCRQNKLWEYLPPELQARLQSTRHRYALRQLQLISQLEQLDQALTARGLQGILLKGSALLFYQIYPSLGDRGTADIDIAVAPAQIAAFVEVLASLSYATEDPILPEITDRTHHLPPFIRLDSLNIEVHPLGKFDGMIQQFSDEIVTTADYPEGFTALQVPTPTELFWHMAWHTWFNLPQLRNILDLHRLRNLHQVDLGLLSQRAQAYGLGHYWELLLEQVEEIVTGQATMSTIHRWEWSMKSRFGGCLYLPNRTTRQIWQSLFAKSIRFKRYPFLYPVIVLWRLWFVGVAYVEWLVSLVTFRGLSPLNHQILE